MLQAGICSQGLLTEFVALPYDKRGASAASLGRAFVHEMQSQSSIDLITKCRFGEEAIE